MFLHFYKSTFPLKINKYFKKNRDLDATFGSVHFLLMRMPFRKIGSSVSSVKMTFLDGSIINHKVGGKSLSLYDAFLEI